MDLGQWFSTVGRLVSPDPPSSGHIGQWQDLNGRGTVDILWVEVTGTAKHPTLHRTTPQNNKFPRQDNSSASSEKS